MCLQRLADSMGKLAQLTACMAGLAGWAVPTKSHVPSFSSVIITAIHNAGRQ